MPTGPFRASGMDGMQRPCRVGTRLQHAIFHYLSPTQADTFYTCTIIACPRQWREDASYAVLSGTSLQSANMLSRLATASHGNTNQSFVTLRSILSAQ